MSDEGLRQARQLMVDAEVPATAIEVFDHYYRQLEAGQTGLIGEDSIDPVTEVDRLDEVQIPPDRAVDALSRTAVIRLNGGLGTSMGMNRAKSLVPVRAGRSFLDLIVEQILALRAEHQVELPLLWMNSFRTQQDTLDALAAHPGIAVDGLPLDFVQNLEPKLRVDDLTPVQWPADPGLEWCPPGHGDIYTVLHHTGLIEQLLDRGFRYATVSNSDNLGAVPDPQLAGWFAESGAPFALEVCRRTQADRKGGHPAIRRSDGRMILRDKAQVADADLTAFMDPQKHRFFNTNNLWWDLAQLHQVITERNAILGLPLIRNRKRVDPTDPDSPEVFQIETAMGAAVEVFEGATAIEVPRSRFLPVKTTSDLLVVRSDAYTLTDDARLESRRPAAPLVELDERHYKSIDAFEQRFPAGPPSLVEADSLTVAGDWTFGADVTVRGSAELEDRGEPQQLPDRTTL